MPSEEHVDANKVKGCVSQVCAVGCRFSTLWKANVLLGSQMRDSSSFQFQIGQPHPAEVTHSFHIQVWVVAEKQDDSKLYWRADSDSELTKASFAIRELLFRSHRIRHAST